MELATYTKATFWIVLTPWFLFGLVVIALLTGLIPVPGFQR